MSIVWAFPTIIVQEEVRDICKQLCTYFAGDSAAGMFEVPVYKDGELYGRISAGAVDANFIVTMTDPTRLAQDAGMAIEDAQYLLSQTIVSEQPLNILLESLNLTLVQNNNYNIGEII